MGAEELSPSGALPNLNADADDDDAGAPPKEKPPVAGAGAGTGALAPKVGTGASFDGCEPKVVGAGAGADPPKENAGVDAGADDALPPNAGAEEESPSSLPRRLLLRSSSGDSLLGILPKAGSALVPLTEEGCSPNLNVGARAGSVAGAGVLPKLKLDDTLDDPLAPNENVGLLDESVLRSEALLAELGMLEFPPFSGRVRLLIGSVAGIGRSGALSGGVDEEGKTNVDFGASSLFFSSPDTLNLKGFFSSFVGAGAGVDANEKPRGLVASFPSSVDAPPAGVLPNEKPPLLVELESLAGAGAAAGGAAGAAPNLNPPPTSPVLAEEGAPPKLNPPPLGGLADDEFPPANEKPPVMGGDAEGAGAFPKEKPPVEEAGAATVSPKENPPVPIEACEVPPAPPLFLEALSSWPGREASQQAHLYTSCSFDARHVPHFHLAF